MKKERKVRLNLMVPPRYLDGLDKAARQDLSNRSVQVRQAIRSYLTIKGISIDDKRPA